MGEDGFTEESKDEEKGMRVVGEISERKKKRWVVLHSTCAAGDCVCFLVWFVALRRLLLASSSSFSSSSSLLSLGCVGEIKSLLFSVANRTTGGFSRIYRPGGRGRRRRGGCGGGYVGGRQAERDTVKSRSSLRRIDCDQLHRTGDGIASLKIQ